MRVGLKGRGKWGVQLDRVIQTKGVNSSTVRGQKREKTRDERKACDRRKTN